MSSQQQSNSNSSVGRAKVANKPYAPLLAVSVHQYALYTVVVALAALACETCNDPQSNLPRPKEEKCLNEQHLSVLTQLQQCKGHFDFRTCYTCIHFVTLVQIYWVYASTGPRRVGGAAVRTPLGSSKILQLCCKRISFRASVRSS